jgi:predicted DNA-binding WGR domain protein
MTRYANLESSLLKEWGRIDGGLQKLCIWFATEEEAGSAYDHALAQRLKREYW